VYVLRCADGTLYTGITTDPARRLEQHNAGTASKYTRARLPVTMVFRRRAKDHSAALRRERAIKKLTRAQKEELVSSTK
jgi:putative endonuclease